VNDRNLSGTHLSKKMTYWKDPDKILRIIGIKKTIKVWKAGILESSSRVLLVRKSV